MNTENVVLVFTEFVVNFKQDHYRCWIKEMGTEYHRVPREGNSLSKKAGRDFIVHREEGYFVPSHRVRVEVACLETSHHSLIGGEEGGELRQRARGMSWSRPKGFGSPLTLHCGVIASV